jgi:SynChlorMet cassette protein ScmC
VEELARIMGLSSCAPNGYPKLIFIRGPSGKRASEKRICRFGENVERDLRHRGWHAHDLALLKLWSHDEVEDIVCELLHEEGNYLLSLSSMRLSLYPLYQATQDSGGLTLHGALVERNGKGVLLAGPRDTGKSTCCRRILKPWRPLCDEETLIVRNGQEKYLAHPFPTWSEYLEERSKKTWNIQRHLPLCAIFFLEQANRVEVIPLGHGEAAVLIYQSAIQMMYRYWKDLDHEVLRTKKKRLFENACELSESIPAFRLHVSVNGRFWEKMESILS